MSAITIIVLRFVPSHSCGETKDWDDYVRRQIKCTMLPLCAVTHILVQSRQEEAIRRAPLKKEDEDMVLRKKETKSEIPCQVSSDVHEWRNDWRTVSGTRSVK